MVDFEFKYTKINGRLHLNISIYIIQGNFLFGCTIT